MICPCCSLLPYDICCRPLHDGASVPSSAHALMRSRFSAFALKKSQYIHDTYVPEERAEHPVEEIVQSLHSRKWTRLDITNIVSNDSHNARVTFTAFFQLGAQEYSFTEDSAFRKEGSHWLYWEAKSKQKNEKNVFGFFL